MKNNSSIFENGTFLFMADLFLYRVYLFIYKLTPSRTHGIHKSITEDIAKSKYFVTR